MPPQSTLACEQAAPLAVHAALRRPGLLDVPLIFNLMIEGCEGGSYTDAYLQGTGSAKLLWRILKSVLAARLRPRADLRLQIFCHHGEAVGFIESRRLYAEGSGSAALITACSIRPDVRGQGLGLALLTQFLAPLPKGTPVLAECSRSAKGMQTQLRRLRFVRDPRHTTPLQRWSLIR